MNWKKLKLNETTIASSKVNVVTHQNFDAAMKRVLKGRSAFLVASATKPMALKKKDFERFKQAGYDLLAKSKDNRGFRLQQGKSKVYLFQGQLHEQEL